MAGFSTEFLSGMAGEESRSRRLGDIGNNDPRRWSWGGPKYDISLVAMFYAKQDLDSWIAANQNGPWSQAFEVVATLDTSDMGGREPFGFVDGISQPEFDWKRERAIPGTTVSYANNVALGELLLGYPDEYGKYTDRPLLDAASDTENDLSPAEDQPSRKDLGRNGSYLVLRQLDQDVRGFWQYLNREASADPDARYRLGACMVGRNLDGEPLIPAQNDNNTFTYDADPEGTQCPFGAHIRRANPRNADLFGHPGGLIHQTASRLGIPRPGLHDDLIASTRFHRVLRRGREYGAKVSPEDALQPASAGDSPCGLHFVCLCANIGRQFEFVQNAWLMRTKFNGLTGESDPLLGNRQTEGDSPTDDFSIPRENRVARRLRGVPQFITVRGGAYLFLPSLRALRYLAHLGNGGHSR